MPPTSPKTSEKVNDQLLQILLVSRKKKTSNTPKFYGKTPLPPSGPTTLGPHCFWVVFVLFVLLLVLLLVAAFLVACAPVAACFSVVCTIADVFSAFAAAFVYCCFWAAVEPPPSPLQCLTFQNVNNNFDNSSEPL